MEWEMSVIGHEYRAWHVNDVGKITDSSFVFGECCIYFAES